MAWAGDWSAGRVVQSLFVATALRGERRNRRPSLPSGNRRSPPPLLACRGRTVLGSQKAVRGEEECGRQARFFFSPPFPVAAAATSSTSCRRHFAWESDRRGMRLGLREGVTGVLFGLPNAHPAKRFSNLETARFILSPRASFSGRELLVHLAVISSFLRLLAPPKP